MTQPDPNNPLDSNPLSPFLDLLKTIAEFFSKLPAILAFVGLIVILFLILLSTGKEIPNALIWFAVSGLVFFVAMNIIDRWFNLQEKKLPVAEPNPSQPEPQPTPQPISQPTPASNADNTPPAEWERRYLRHLLTHDNQLPLALIDSREADDRSTPLLLQDIFTPLDVPAQQQQLPESLSDEALAEAQAKGRLSREPVLKALSRPENKHMVLLGDPGSGKSTLVQYLTLCLAGDHLKHESINQAHLQEHGWQLGQMRLWPVRVILREYAYHGLAKNQSIWEFIDTQLKSKDIDLPGCSQLIKDRLEKEGGLMMLDGLDEVEQSDEVRASLKREIEKFVQVFPQVRVLVTSRPYAYGSSWQLPDFQVTRLLPFDDEQIETFINQWYTAKGSTLGPEQADQYAKSLIREVKDKRKNHLRDLAERPLLLTMMVSIHRGQHGEELPQKRAQLYAESVKLLLERWQRGKTISGQQTKSLLDELGIGSKELLNRLAQVAFLGHSAQPKEKDTADIPSNILVSALYGDLNTELKKQPHETVAMLMQRGLLTDPNDPRNKILQGRDVGLLADQGRNPDNKQNIYRFPHRSFQEYLAGLHFLNDKDYPQLLLQEVGRDPQRWREAVLLAAASAEFSHMIWTMVHGLCPESPPSSLEPTDNRAWLPFLAAQALVDSDEIEVYSGSIAEQTRPRVQQWQRAIVENGLLPPRDRAQAGKALATLGDDRPGVLTCDEMRFCTVPGGPFWLDNWQKNGRGDWYTGLDQPYWLGQYPVTAAQFREFVQESDYKPAYDERPLRLPDNWPVVWINWYDALAFTEWLDARWRGKGWLPEGYRLTLPSEVEWEKAARGGQEIPQTPQILTADRLLSLSKQALPTQANAREGQDLSRRTYPWGDEPEQEETETGGLYRANNEKAGIGEPCAVGSFPAGISPYGCLDMSGQVWEWTRSKYGEKYAYPPTLDYETIESRNKENMVLRGGAYYKDQNVCSARLWDVPHNRFFRDNCGVRVVVSPFLTADL